MTNKENFDRMWRRLSPEQQALTRTLSQLKAENTLLIEQNKALMKEHRDIWRFWKKTANIVKEEE